MRLEDRSFDRFPDISFPASWYVRAEAIQPKGAVDRLVCEAFVPRVLVPRLRPGHIVVLDNLSANASLFNASGTTACVTPSGRPYVNVDVRNNGVFATRERAVVTLEFTNPSGEAITYTPLVLAGANR